MDEAQIKQRLLEAKDRLFWGVRSVLDKDEPVFPLVGALLPDGQFPVQNMGAVPESMLQTVLAKASDDIRAVGAVGALFFADGTVEPDAPAKDGEEVRALVCHLAMKHWSEVWVWVYRLTEDGWAWDESPAATAEPGQSMAWFMPFPQIPVMRGVVH